MSPGAWDYLYLVLALLFMARFFYFYAFGVHFGDRALSLGGAGDPRLRRGSGRVLREGAPVRIFL